MAPLNHAPNEDIAELRVELRHFEKVMEDGLAPSTGPRS